MLRAGTLKDFDFEKREKEKEVRSRSGKKRKELVAPLALSLVHDRQEEQKKLERTHPHAERDLAPGLGQGLGDGPAEALVVGDAGDERLLACKRVSNDEKGRGSVFS